MATKQTPISAQLLQVPQAPPDSTFLDPADAKIQDIYNALRGDLQQGQQVTQGILDRGQQQVGSAYDQAASAATAAQGTAMGTLAAEAKRLGIERALPASGANLTTDLAQFLQNNAGRKATQQGSLAEFGTGDQALGQMGIDSSRKEMAQQRVDIMKALQQALIGMRGNESKAAGDLNTGLLQLALQEASGQTDIAKLEASLAGQRASSGGGGGGGGMTIAEQIALAKFGPQMELLDQQLHPKPKSGQGALDYFENNAFDAYGGKAGPRFKNAVSQIINSANSAALKSKATLSGSDPYQQAIDQIAQLQLVGQYSNLNKDALRQAAAYFYGKQ